MKAGREGKKREGTGVDSRPVWITGKKGGVMVEGNRGLQITQSWVLKKRNRVCGAKNKSSQEGEKHRGT